MKSMPDSLSYLSSDSVVITGRGAVCSLGNSVEEINRTLMAGKSGAEEIIDFDTGEFSFPAARVKNLPAVKTDIHPQLARTMGKHLSLLLSSIEGALNSARIGSGMFDARDIGFFAGMGMVDYRVEDLLPAVLKSLNQAGDLDYDRFFQSGYQEIYPLWPLGMLNNVAFCQAAIHFGLRGENCVFSPHGDAGIAAVAEAVKVLEEGKAKVALAGGVGEEVSPFSLARARLKGLVRPPGEDHGAAVFLGEGGAMLVLEPLSGAVEREADILGRIAGFGFSSHRDEKPGCASREAISSAIKGALSHAGCDPGRISLIMLGSLSQKELEAVREIFGMNGEAPIMVNTAELLGETLAAGPILNTAIGLSIPDLKALPFHPPSSVLRPPYCVLVNGISYEGRCASMIVEKAGETTI
jgi:3-oxoacyl-[acyl-carrier-protein] synthase II